MNLAQPGFLLLALFAVPVLLAMRSSRAPLPRGQVRAVALLQVLAIVAAALALARPWQLADGGEHRVVVFGGGGAAEAVQDLADLRAASPQRDPFLVVRAGSAPVVGLPGGTTLPEAAGTPDLTAALRAAAAAIPAGARGRVHLWTDGRHDGAPIAVAANELRARGIAVEVRTLPAPAPGGAALLDVDHVPRVAPGEAFRLAATVRATAALALRLEVTAADAIVGAADIQVAVGEQLRTVDVVVPGQGLVELGVRLVGQGVDPSAATERTAVLVDGPLRILHLAADQSRRDALAASLRRHGIETFAPADPGNPLAATEQFWDCRAVLVDDLPAAAWSANQGLVRAGCLQGRGLVLAGTHHNLGPGGYAGTELAEILPVRMPQREERRDPSVSLVLIVDTSGSMGGGRLELAKEVARLAMQKLQPHDKVGLIEFHGSKRWAAPLQPATNTIEITRALNRLQVGGGTIIYEALEESYFALLNAQTRFQHVLVLTDGGVESGPFEALARRMATAGQTVSTVLIGPQANSPFLLNLAQWGRGRFYACPDKFQMPDLQFREPQSALLPAVQERRLPLVRGNEAEATAAFGGDQIAPSGGIVEASVRDGAEVLLRGAAGEPFLVGWDQGAGRVLVMTGQALGPQSGELHDDPAYGAFLADLLRSAAAGDGALAPRLQLQAQERGVRVRLVGATHGPAPFVAHLGDKACALAPVGDRSEGFLPWPGTDAVVVEVRCEQQLVAAGAACPPAGRARRTADSGEALRQLAAATADVAPPVPQPADLGHLFALAAIALFVAALVLRRIPLDGGARNANGPARRGAGAITAAVALCVLAGGLRAQDPAPIPPVDEAAVRAAIDAELRTHGDLGELAARWRQAPPLHRYWLARASGDLQTAQQLCADPALAATHRDVRVQMLDVLGRPAEALAALGEPDPQATPVDRGHWLLRRAWLRMATGDRDGTAADLQAAVAAAGQPAFAQQAGVLAASFGFFELGLQWHRVGDTEGRDAFQAALRRGLWQRRTGELAKAAAEYELAFARATMQRDRAFALAMLAAAHRSAGSLPRLADAWLLRANGTGAPLHAAELQALGEVLRELGRARDGLQLLARLPAAARAQLGELALTLAVEAGEPEAAIAQLRTELARQPDDAATRCSLALLLADLQRDGEAIVVLRDGIPGARPRALRQLGEAASELGRDEVVEAVAAALTAGSDDGGGAVEGVLFEVAHLRRQGKDSVAVQRLLAARGAAARPQDRLRLAEQLESLGKKQEATELYTRIWEEAATEDIGMRLGWLLSDSKVEADRLRAQAIFRQVWTSAGSAARRVQAEDHVLDLAAREGTLADLALELEAQLADPATPNRPAVRDALVKIYTRARDTTGAVTILQKWAADEPERRVEALQQLARVHLSAEEFRNHERVLQQLLDADPEGELDYRQQLAMSALERGRPEDARRHIRGLLGKPGTPDTIALEFSAGIYALAAQHEESVRLYRRALALHPERVETFLLLGNALRAAGQREAAIGTFQELLLRPLPDDLFVVAVDGLLNMEAPAPVVAAAARAVRLRLAARPEQVFLHRVLQDLLEAQQDEPGRMRALEDTVVAAGEQCTNFVRELMQEAETKRDWRTYADHGRTMLLLGDEVPPAVYLSLGEALLHTGDLDAAARSFARARLGTDFAAVEARTAELYENAGRLAEAERIRARLLRRTPEEPAAVLAVARLAERQGAVERALPHWLGASLRLLPAELDAGRPAAGRRLPIVRSTREPAAVAFAEPFAGALRCAASLADLAALRDAILAASASGPAPRRLQALRLLRHLALAYPEPELAAALRAGEDELLASADAETRRELRARRLLAGDLAGAQAVAADAEVTPEELRILLLAGDPQALAAAAARAKVALLPELARLLLLAGRRPEAEALLPLADAAGDEAALAARNELRTMFGLPVATDSSKAQQRLEQALQRPGALSAKINLVFAAMRDLPDLPAGERAGHVQALASAVIAAKDAAAAERLLSQARDELAAETATQLVELSFTSIERVFQVQSRAQHLGLLPTERGIELLRGALRRFREEERRQQLLQMFGNAQIPEAVLLALVPDCDPRGVQGTDRFVFANGLERAKPSPAVLKALADRFAATMPDDALTVLLRVRTAGDAEAQRQAARQAVPTLASRRLADRDETIVGSLVRSLTPEDARALLQQLPESAPLEVRVPLAQRSGDKQAAAAALMAAHQQKPDDTSRLYAAANFFESEGMFAEAAKLYRTARATSPTFYPYQAQQLARLELQAGNALGALDALRAARDPAQTNFRLVLRVLAEVQDEALRRAALADVLQQRAARGASSGVVFSMVRALGGGSTAAGDRLAAVLAPARLPPLAPKDLADAEDAPSDYDLLAFLPEGEQVARTLLRTLDDAARGADLGIHRGMLGAAARHGRAGPIVAAAVATLQASPHDAEAMRTVLAGAQVGIEVPRDQLLRVLRHVATEGRPQAATIGSVIGLASAAGEPALAEQVLRQLLQQRAAFADAQLRPWMPGLFAMACQQLPDLVLQLAREGGLDSDAEAELTAALVLHHPDPAAAVAVVQQRPRAAAERPAGIVVSRNGSDLLPQCGAALVAGDLDAAVKLLEQPGTYWMQARMLGGQRLAAAVPPLGRWGKPEQARAFGERLLMLLAGSEAERAGALARVGAVLVARLRAADQAEAADELRSKLRAATTGTAWRAADWLGE